MALSDLTTLLSGAARCERTWRAGTSLDFHESMQAHKDLVEALEAMPELAAPHGHFLMSGAGGLGIQPTFLAGYLIRIAMDYGADRAIADLELCLQSTEWPARYVTAIRGVQCDEALDLGSGISLVPYSEIEPEAETMERLFNPETPHTALVQTCKIIRTHDAEASPPRVDVQTICDFALVLMLAIESGVERGSSGVHVLGDAPLLVKNVMFRGDPIWVLNVEPFPVALTPEKRERAVRLCSRFSALEDKDKKWLRLVLTWLNDAMLDLLPVQAAIKLRVALESLFLDDKDKGEYQFTTSLRAAWFLAGSQTLSERQRIRRSTRDAYGQGSRAVHRGELKACSKARETLKRGIDVAVRACEKVLLQGKPDWDSVTLGGECQSDGNENHDVQE